MNKLRLVAPMLVGVALVISACVSVSGPSPSPGVSPTSSASRSTPSGPTLTAAPTSPPQTPPAATATPILATPPPAASPTSAQTAEASKPASPAAPSVPAPSIHPWAADAQPYRGRNGERFTYICPPDGFADSVWGTDIYTDDSGVCTAGVHKGAITFEAGGTVTIIIRPGQDSYEGSERNGVSTSDWGSWGGSFEVVLEE